MQLFAELRVVFVATSLRGETKASGRNDGLNQTHDQLITNDGLFRCGTAVAQSGSILASTEEIAKLK